LHVNLVLIPSCRVIRRTASIQIPFEGIKQPGCGPDVVGSCSHHRAPEYFKESLMGGKPFKAVKCESWEDYTSDLCADAETVNLGYDVDQS